MDIWPDRIGANVGCNSLSGDLEVGPGQLVVGPIFSTRMYCEAVMPQEQAVSELLEASPHFFVEGGHMAIVSGKHRAELVRMAD